MERVPETELMDDVAQAKAYSDADFEAQHGRLIEILGETFAEKLPALILSVLPVIRDRGRRS